MHTVHTSGIDPGFLLFCLPILLRSWRAFDACKVTANILHSLHLLDLAVQEMNAGADILRAGFTPETAFSAIHNVLSDSGSSLLFTVA